MNDIEQRLKAFENEFLQAIGDAAVNVRDLQVVYDASGSCVQVQWVGGTRCWQRLGFLGSPPSKDKIQFEARVFFRNSGPEPDGWPEVPDGIGGMTKVAGWHGTQVSKSRFLTLVTSAHFNRPAVPAVPLPEHNSGWRLLGSGIRGASDCAKALRKAILEPQKKTCWICWVLFFSLLAALGLAGYFFRDRIFSDTYEGADYTQSPTFYDQDDDGGLSDNEWGASDHSNEPEISTSSTEPEKGYQQSVADNEEDRHSNSEGDELPIAESGGAISAPSNPDMSVDVGLAQSQSVRLKDLPHCWVTNEGVVEPAYRVFREEGGIRIEPNYSAHRKSQFEEIPNEGLVFSHPISAEDFEQIYEPVFLFSLSKGCRLAIEESGPESGSYPLGDYRPAIAGYFYIIPRN